MPSTTANTALYATISGRYPVVNIASGTTSSTYSKVCDAGANGSIVTDLLFRNTDIGRSFDIIICATGSQATAENSRVQIAVASGAGNTSAVALTSLAALVPSLFDIDLAGNRVITLEAGWSIYVKSTTTTAAAIFVTAKMRDY